MTRMHCISIVLCLMFLLSLSSLQTHGATTPPTATSQTVSLDVQNADVRDVLRLLAETGGVNILTSGEVQGTITTRLHDVPWEQALAAVLTLTGLAQERQGNVILVALAERLRSARQERLQAQQLEAQAESKITHVVRVNYAKASELKTHLEKLLGACASISADNRTNSLILTGTPACLRVWEGAAR